MYRQRNYIAMVLLLVLMVVLLIIIMMKVSDESEGSDPSSQKYDKRSVEPCVMIKDCPEKQVSFYIQSGAGPSVDPKICIQNKLVLGSQLKNTGYGVNMVILNGSTGEVSKVDHFTHNDEKQPLIDLLKTLEKGSVVLIASYDNIASRLDDEARELIAELGSSSVLSLNTRDSWVFVGGKGAAAELTFEEHLKSDKKNNKYDNWPELVDLKGCIPDFLE
ncbi:protein FAM3C [Labrus mixtus]|uniref:protein FAM3C n=1 Tax=Labrus mixtus TaxID=508554 RepID=UPI0029BFFFA8|nr:protein FAM3C [Labrus mixtus]